MQDAGASPSVLEDLAPIEIEWSWSYSKSDNPVGGGGPNVAQVVLRGGSIAIAGPFDTFPIERDVSLAILITPRGNAVVHASISIDAIDSERNCLVSFSTGYKTPRSSTVRRKQFLLKNGSASPFLIASTPGADNVVFHGVFKASL